MKHIVIVGGGASGLISAIHAKTSNNKVTVLERNSSCGKKILATGNGKCNYWNIDQNIKHYHSNNEELLEQIITKEMQDKVINFFNSLGIVPKIKNGYYYPFSNQATTIKNALLNEVKKKDIEIRQDFLVESIEKEDNHFIIKSSNEIIKADKVIIATGSCASPKTGSDGIGYKLLKRLSHTVIEPKPALVQLKTTGNFLKEWAGIRTDVKVSLYENDKLIKEESGEIQLTDYGISGICVFNLSRYVSIGLEKNLNEEVMINFLPFIEKNPYEYLTNLLKNNYSVKTQLENILNNKLVTVILNKTNIDENKSFNNLREDEKVRLINNLISFKVKVIGTNSFDQAQVCSGGIPLTEIDLTTMESKLVKGLYIVGELLDVDGDCGGYNLGFAWMSGIKAGIGCSEND
ncbi:MAG: NAD(P)/FAD-dependent oxidoreductase [Bacilli bacterium]|nr:NAD(P)/FAD-dependent oxidoreductase [Bacilli bacterium]